jgi:hypothetical protein
MVGKPSRKCTQCEKLAVAVADGIPLCVDCFYKLEVAKTLAVRMHVIHMNYAADQMDFATGLRNFTPKMQVPDIPRGPIILHNIKIDNSVVGAINTGKVQTIDVNITYLKTGGNDELGEALKRLTEAIANSQAMSQKEKAPLLDQVEYLAEQAAFAAKDRKPGVIRATLAGLTQAATAVTGIATAWSAVEPLLKAHFGIG